MRNIEVFKLFLDNYPIMSWIIDENAKCIFCNKEWIGFSGRKIDEELGEGWITRIHKEDVDNTYKSFISSFNNRERINLKYRILNNKSEYRWISDVAAPIILNGNFKGYIVAKTDITDILLNQDKTEKIAQKVSEKNKELEKFAYVVSHDIRTPLLNIHGFTKEIQDSVNNIKTVINSDKSLEQIRSELNAIFEEDIPFCFEHIYTSTRKIDNLLNGILKYSRVGREGVVFEEVDCKELIDSVMSNFNHLLSKIDTQLDINVNGYCFGNKVMLNQLFSNLIDNSIKYRKENVKLNLILTNKDNKNNYEFTIKDNGIGIDENNLTKIFDVFYRVENKNDGNGIGLSIVKKIIELHNAEINIKSEIDKGTEFKIIIPKNLNAK